MDDEGHAFPPAPGRPRQIAVESARPVAGRVTDRLARTQRIRIEVAHPLEEHERPGPMVAARRRCPWAPGRGRRGPAARRGSSTGDAHVAAREAVFEFALQRRAFLVEPVVAPPLGFIGDAEEFLSVGRDDGIPRRVHPRRAWNSTEPSRPVRVL